MKLKLWIMVGFGLLVPAAAMADDVNVSATDATPKTMSAAIPGAQAANLGVIENKTLVGNIIFDLNNPVREPVADQPGDHRAVGPIPSLGIPDGPAAQQGISPSEVSAGIDAGGVTAGPPPRVQTVTTFDANGNMVGAPNQPVKKPVIPNLLDPNILAPSDASKVTMDDVKAVQAAVTVTQADQKTPAQPAPVNRNDAYPVE